jgi:hypothetical protein
LESSLVRPRQARYQAALRPDMIDFYSSLLCELVAKTLKWDSTLAAELKDFEIQIVLSLE